MAASRDTTLHETEETSTDYKVKRTGETQRLHAWEADKPTQAAGTAVAQPGSDLPCPPPTTNRVFIRRAHA